MMKTKGSYLLPSDGKPPMEDRCELGLGDLGYIWFVRQLLIEQAKVCLKFALKGFTPLLLPTTCIETFDIGTFSLERQHNKSLKACAFRCRKHDLGIELGHYVQRRRTVMGYQWKTTPTVGPELHHSATCSTAASCHAATNCAPKSLPFYPLRFAA